MKRTYVIIGIVLVVAVIIAVVVVMLSAQGDCPIGSIACGIQNGIKLIRP